MGGIVFSTIVENIKSFFGREDELLAQPKQVPESASEVYGGNSRIVEKPLPPAQPSKLPFTPEQLRAAIPKPTAQQPEPLVEHHELKYEIDEFEHALKDAHTVAPPTAVPAAPPPQVHARPDIPAIPDQHTFFSEFGRFLLEDDVDAESILEKDVLHRMREFHRHHKQGKEYYVYSKDVQAAVQRKLSELKTLEHEWFHTREQLDELERGMADVEREIENRTADLKRLLLQARAKSRLEREVEEGKEFILSDGRKLRSLLDLKIALRTMPDDIFHHHVTATRNDFAAWALGSMNDPELASELGRIRDKHQMDVFLSRLAG